MFGLYELFEGTCRANMDKTALISGEERLSYSELLALSELLAVNLQSRSVHRGSRVTLLFKNSPSMLGLYFALLRIGAQTSPLNYRESLPELGHLSKCVNAEFLVCADSFAEQGESLCRLSGAQLILESELLRAPAAGSRFLPEERRGEDVVLNIFTGGTTGTPKAASHTNNGLLCQIKSCFDIESPVTSDDIFLNYAPMFHIGGFTAAMQTLCAGATFIISRVFEPEQLLGFIARERVTQMSLIPPSLCTELLKCGGLSEDALSSVRMVRMSGGACTVDNIKKVFAIFPNAKAFVGYGMSERAVNMVNIIDRSHPIREIGGNISVGKPGTYNECKLVDESGAQITRPGVVGEVLGRGPCTMVGYYGRSNSFDSDGWFATGDLMFFDGDGYYYFVDRKKDMIKSGGENVYSNVVEQILNSHPSVLESAVVGIPDERLGEMVAAAVVLRDGAPPVTEQELMDYCGTKGAGFKKARRIVFVSELPHSKMGKVDRHAVRELICGRR